MRIQAIVLPIIVWSLYYSLGKKKSSNSLNVIVEVLPITDGKIVSRDQAKRNLHKIRENNAKRKIENVLFDKFWYINREQKQRRERIRRQKDEEKKTRLQQEIEKRSRQEKLEKVLGITRGRNTNYLTTKSQVNLKESINLVTEDDFHHS